MENVDVNQCNRVLHLAKKTACDVISVPCAVTSHLKTKTKIAGNWDKYGIQTETRPCASFCLTY